MLAPLVLVLTTLAAGPEPGLLFHATFDGSVDAWSLAGHGRPATAVTPAPAFQPGKFGQALVGGPDLASISYPTEGNLFAAAGTVSMWVQPVNWTPQDGNFHSFFESGQERGQNGWLVLYKYYQNGWLLLRYADEKDAVGMATATPAWKPGEWHHLAATWSAETLRIYLDGDLAAQAPGRVGQSLGETFRVGDHGWHLHHQGDRTLVDDVRIYGYPLGANEVRRLARRASLAVTRDPLQDTWHTRLALPAAGLATGGTVTVKAAGKVALDAKLTVQGDVGTADLAVGSLPPGEYQVAVQAVDALGRPVFDEATTVKRLAAERVVLANERLRLTFDGGSGGILAIEAPQLGFRARPLAAPAPIVQCQAVDFVGHARFYQPSDVKELIADGATLTSLTVQPTASGQRLTATYQLHPQVTATLTVDLPRDSPAAALRLKLTAARPLRPSQAVRVPQVTFPQVDGLRLSADGASDQLASGWIQGEVLPQPGKALPLERAMQYPGTASQPWQDLYGPTGGLWLGPQADGRSQLEIVAGARDGKVALANRWHCLLEPGETWDSPVVELAVHPGAWHWGAERFRTWALQQTPPRRQPDWLATCDGWYGLGHPGYTFKGLPDLLATGQYYGFNYLQLWSEMIIGGAYYSWFYPNPEIGTVAELKDGIRRLHAAGGHIGFYSNAICFDAAVDGNELLRELLAKYQVKDHPPLPKFYDEALHGVFVGPAGAYGHGGAEGHSRSGYPDGYWAMDPNAAWWQDYLAGWIGRWHHEYGADIWYLDSFPVHGYGLGPASYALGLPHPRGLSEGQLALLKRIRREFDGPMLYEGVACAALMPYTNWCLGTELSFGSTANSRPEIFAYTLSDVYPVFSGTCNTWTGIGRIFPDLAKPRQEDAMNYVFCLGERFDLLGPVKVDPNWTVGEHVKRLAALRRKVQDVVYRGRMRDSLGLSGVPDKVVARVFVRQQPASVVVAIWDRRSDRQPWTLRLDPAQWSWPADAKRVRRLNLDGTEQALGQGWTVPIQPAEVLALRLE